MKNKKISNLFIIFIIFSIIGPFYEELLSFITSIITNKNYVFKRNSSLLIGYFRPVYGIGAVLATIFLNENKPFIKNLLLGSIIEGLTEYTISLLQEQIFSTVTWDYSNKLLNINGRTTIIYSIIWGLFAALYIKYLYPKLITWLNKINPNIKYILTTSLIIFISYDITISSTILLRQNLRNKNITYFTKLENIIDTKFNDTYIKKKFPYFIYKKKN